MGTLKIIIGPMYSGKTTELINDFKDLQVNLIRKKQPANIIAQVAIDYKNIGLLKKYISDNEKIRSSKITSVSFNKQRKLTREIKKAKILGLI